MYRETKELPATEARPISPYHHIAEMIRLGCERFPNQAFNRVTDRSHNAACAIGAAQAGASRTIRGGYQLQAFLTLKEWSQCPLCPATYLIGGVVTHLNDRHRSTREWIADWLDRL